RSLSRQELSDGKAIRPHLAENAEAAEERLDAAAAERVGLGRALDESSKQRFELGKSQRFVDAADQGDEARQDAKGDACRDRSKCLAVDQRVTCLARLAMRREEVFGRVFQRLTRASQASR